MNKTEENMRPISSAGIDITLRDYFAARMMAFELNKESRPHEDYNYRNAASRAYKMADAMLEVRARQPKAS
jgi:hypothetical protein